MINFVHFPPAALHDSEVMNLATHFSAIMFKLSGGQFACPVSLLGMIHKSKEIKILAQINKSFVFQSD